MSGPYRGAFEKGRAAALAGEPESACPYSDLRTAANRVSFSRAFIKAWHEGYDSIEYAPAPVSPASAGRQEELPGGLIHQPTNREMGVDAPDFGAARASAVPSARVGEQSDE